MNRKYLTAEQALQKMRHYCAYQERSHQEVKERLRALGIRRNDAEQIISRLIEDDFLNEERYAKAYARGKFRMKSWGRCKIRRALQTNKVSDYCIRKALQEIPDDDYRKTITELATRKYGTLGEEQYLVRKAKTRQYLLQKGFEPDLVSEALVHLLQGTGDTDAEIPG
jgi:regulatory protein